VKDLERDLARSEAMARRGLVLASLLRLKQICNHPSQWLGDGDYAEKSSGKLLRLRELCEPIAERQERVLVFTQFLGSIVSAGLKRATKYFGAPQPPRRPRSWS
jgi:non-specific serine/threonine protein kinase